MSVPRLDLIHDFAHFLNCVGISNIFHPLVNCVIEVSLFQNWGIKQFIVQAVSIRTITTCNERLRCVALSSACSLVSASSTYFSFVHNACWSVGWREHGTTLRSSEVSWKYLLSNIRPKSASRWQWLLSQLLTFCNSSLCIISNRAKIWSSCLLHQVLACICSVKYVWVWKLLLVWWRVTWNWLARFDTFIGSWCTTICSAYSQRTSWSKATTLIVWLVKRFVQAHFRSTKNTSSLLDSILGKHIVLLAYTILWLQFGLERRKLLLETLGGCRTVHIGLMNINTNDILSGRVYLQTTCKFLQRDVLLLDAWAASIDSKRNRFLGLVWCKSKIIIGNGHLIRIGVLLTYTQGHSFWVKAAGNSSERKFVCGWYSFCNQFYFSITCLVSWNIVPLVWKDCVMLFFAWLEPHLIVLWQLLMRGGHVAELWLLQGYITIRLPCQVMLFSSERRRVQLLVFVVWWDEVLSTGGNDDLGDWYGVVVIVVMTFFITYVIHAFQVISSNNLFGALHTSVGKINQLSAVHVVVESPTVLVVVDTCLVFERLNSASGFQSLFVLTC